MQHRHRTIAAPGTGAEEARATVLRVLGERADLTVHEVAPGRIAVARTTRPRWALVACALTIWLLGLGLLFLLVRQTHAGEVTVTDGPRGCVVTAPPVIGVAAHHELERALLGSRAREPVATDGAAIPGPDRWAPVVDGLEDPTVARSGSASEPSAPAAAEPPEQAALVLRFAHGEVRVAPGGSAVLGRDPSSDGTAIAALVPGGSDAAATVSKSHLLVTFDGATARAQDLGSTNGSTLVRDDQVEPVPSDRPVAVVDGDELRLGAVPCQIVMLPKVAM